MLAASAVVAGRVAIGAYAGAGTGGAAPSSDAPTLTQTVARTGGELSLVLQPSAGSLLLLGPQVGVLAAPGSPGRSRLRVRMQP